MFIRPIIKYMEFSTEFANAFLETDIKNFHRDSLFLLGA